jgi:hypothetical protein
MNAFTEPDPAERSAFNRLFYRNRPPDVAWPLGQPVLLLVGVPRALTANLDAKADRRNRGWRHE